MHEPRNYAIVVAGGAGRRMGAETPKQYLPLAGIPLLDRTLVLFAESPDIDAVVVALPPDTDAGTRARYAAFPKVAALVDGGAERTDSVRAGLGAVPADAAVVLVHDAVRPLASIDLVRRCVEGALSRGAVVPVVPVRDTVKSWDEGKGSLVTRDRSEIFRAQTPQAFRREILVAAYEAAARDGIAGTDDAALVERISVPIHPVDGEEENMKITTPPDMRMAEGLVGALPDIRTGIGYDAHRLVEGRPLFLGGIEIPHGKGLLGHSDGDVLLHAAADALYGAIGDRDIGFHFPPDRDETKGIDSRSIVAHARGRMEEGGFALLSLDMVVACEAPKVAPYADAIRTTVAGLLGVDQSRVNVRGKTTEGMGFEGRGEGISARAVALVGRHGRFA